MSLAEVNAGFAIVKIFADNTDLASTLKRTESLLGKFRILCDAVGKQLALIGGTMTLPLKQAADAFMQFDNAMRSVGAVTESTGQAFAEMAERAKQLGAETSFSAQQVAEGMASLGRMGFKPKEINNAIDDMMNLSRATWTDLATASQIAANNMSVFGIKASKAAKVADVLTVTANSSAQTSTDLGEALKTAGQTLKRQSGWLLQNLPKYLDNAWGCCKTCFYPRLSPWAHNKRAVFPTRSVPRRQP